MIFWRFWILPILLIVGSALYADEMVAPTENFFHQFSPPLISRFNPASLGPEIYRVYRARHGGTKQSGNAVGVRFTFDHIKRYCIYCGMQGFYGSGILHGYSASGSKIRSRLTDSLIEGSLGYTFQMKYSPYVALTPYLGCGYFREVNDFSPPSPLPVKFVTKYPYVAFGFLSSIYVTSYLTAGLNVRFKAPWETKCTVSNDPDFDKVKQLVTDKIQYRIEVPITYIGSLAWSSFEAALVPFYERRLYGARENYPFDFFETRFSIYGLNLQLIYRF